VAHRTGYALLLTEFAATNDAAELARPPRQRPPEIVLFARRVYRSNNRKYLVGLVS
jgi:hypothetical protein